MLLARELPNLGRLFDDEAGLALLRETLRLAQGHPKLLELADGQAADRAALAARVAAAGDELADRAEVLDAFFAVDVPRQGETRQEDEDFVAALRDWTGRVAGGLPPAAGLLLAFLCRLEPEDRQRQIVETVWPHFLTRLGEGHAAAVAARAEPELGLPAALAALERAGLVAVVHPELDPAQVARLAAALAGDAGDLDPAALPGLLAGFMAGAATYTIHPGVAEAARAGAGPGLLDAADVELGDYHVAMFLQSAGAGDGGPGRRGGRQRPPRRALPAAPGALGGGVHPAGADAPARQQPGQPGLSPCRCCAASSRPRRAPSGG